MDHNYSIERSGQSEEDISTDVLLLLLLHHQSLSCVHHHPSHGKYYSFSFILYYINDNMYRRILHKNIPHEILSEKGPHHLF